MTLVTLKVGAKPEFFQQTGLRGGFAGKSNLSNTAKYVQFQKYDSFVLCHT